MDIDPPTPKDLERLAAAHRLTLTAGELAAAAAVLPGMTSTGMITALGKLVAQEGAAAPPRGRRVMDRPSPAEDPYNAILRRCSVRSARAGGGTLAGKRVGVKDSISVAGVPLTAGSRLLGDYVPSRDATIVTRLLDAGAEIVAILNMDDLALSGRGDTSAFGPVRNPHDPTRLAGGSSGGSAAALFYDGIDLTIGCDQGGSIRIPASWCGVVGLKPTHGLVPYTGIVGMDATIDHVGPMARTVADVARALDVIAGKDPADPRQAEVRVEPYAAALSRGVTGMRIGVLREGFGLPGAEADVDEAVRRAVQSLVGLGAEAVEVSMPEHAFASAALMPIVLEGMHAFLTADGVGHHFNGYYDGDLARAFARGLRERPNDLPSNAKLVLLGGAFLAERYPGKLYAAAQNLRPAIRAAYDRVLEQVDLLAMPTTPMKAQRYDPDIDPIGLITLGLEMTANTAPFDVTGHPALNVPAEVSDGLPIGLMLVGRRFDDATVLRAAHAYEQQRG